MVKAKQKNCYTLLTMVYLKENIKFVERGTEIVFINLDAFHNVTYDKY